MLQALAPGGELLVYGALATHRQTDPSALTIPVFARSFIYEAKTVRGFWLFRWIVTTPPEEAEAAVTEARNLVTDGILEIPDGQRIDVERFAEGVVLAESPAHGTKPLFVFD